MNKKNLTRVAGLSAAAMLALSGMAMAETTESALVKGGALNLRETASLDAKVLGQYPTGTLVEIIKAGSEWHRVSVNGKTGYMLAKYLNSADSAISATVRTNTGTGLNLREQPNMNGKIISKPTQTDSRWQSNPARLSWRSRTVSPSASCRRAALGAASRSATAKAMWQRST